MAHVRQDTSGEWIERSLDVHLRGVTRIAADFAMEVVDFKITQKVEQMKT